MNRNYLLFFFCITLLPFSFAQKSVTTLSFTGMLNNQHIDLDSIWVQNYSQQCDTLLIWPDTVLSFSTVGTQDISAGSDGYNLVQYNSTDSKSDIYIRLLIPVPTEARWETSFLFNNGLGFRIPYFSILSRKRKNIPAQSLMQRLEQINKNRKSQARSFCKLQPCFPGK
ncbi:MAG: hypothetical protein NTU44_14365 [Bacteroidetes bacterium]|nr:hypothetical protein [Bacteroidota bacterium]